MFVASLTLFCFKVLFFSILFQSTRRWALLYMFQASKSSCGSASTLRLQWLKLCEFLKKEIYDIVLVFFNPLKIQWYTTLSTFFVSFGDFLLKCMLIKGASKLSSIVHSLRYNITIIFIFLSTSETRGPLSITRAYKGILRPTGVSFEDLRCIGGSLYVYGKLPIYPSPRPILTLTSHLGQNVG